VKTHAEAIFAAMRTALYMTGFVALWGWLAVSVKQFDPQIGIAFPCVARSLGVAVMAIGATIGLLCGFLFAARGHGTPVPFDSPREFVRTGPYRYVRNPMYSGGLLLLIGFGLFQRAVSVLLLAVGASLLAHLFVVFFEEPGLERRFGESYRRYKQSVNRWLPALRSRPERGS
jgi:protein-S-isoprenylcysteine O-methyltransferase Ste14